MVNRALKMMNRFAAIQQRVDLAPELLNRDVVTQESRAQQPAEAFRRPVQRIALGGCAEALQRQRSRDTSRSDRCRQPQQFIQPGVS